MSTFTLTDMNTVLGAYCQENTQQIFLDAIYSPTEADGATVWNYMQKVVIRDEAAMGLADFDIEVEESSHTFNDQGSVVNLDALKPKLRSMDASFTLPIFSLYGSWMQHIYNEAYHNRMNAGDVTLGLLSFSQWLVDGIVKNFMQKFMLRTSFLGTYTADYDYTGGLTNSFDAAADGFVTLAKAERDAVGSKIPAAQQIATGAFTGTNAYNNVESMAKALPPKLLYKPHIMCMSVANGDFYNEDYASEFSGANPLIHDSYKRMRTRSRSKVLILPTPEMGSSPTVFSTPMNNMLWFSDFDNQPPQIFTAVADPLNIKVTMRYKAAFEFKRYDHLIINDQ